MNFVSAVPELSVARLSVCVKCNNIGNVGKPGHDTFSVQIPKPSLYLIGIVQCRINGIVFPAQFRVGNGIYAVSCFHQRSLPSGRLMR